MNINFRPIEIGIENRDAIGRTRALFIAGRSRQQHDLVGDLRGGGPDLLAVNEITPGALLRERLDARGVQSGIRFGEAEAALILPSDQPRNPSRFLVRRALDDDGMRPEQIDMHGRSRRHAAAMACDLVHHDCGFGHTKSGAAKLFRHSDAKPARLGHRPMKLKRKYAVIIARQPILVAEAAHDRANSFPDCRVIVRRLEFVGQQ